MVLKKTFLIVAFGMVLVIALLYGISPQWFGKTFLGLEQLDRNIAHILRAVMGLYIALGLFWLYSAFHAPFRNVAVLTTAIFAGGLVAGRIVSLAIEGTPAPLLIFYVIAELSLAPLAWWIYTRED
jgi:uncharacterized protein YjeT (DUF2065 family)